MSIVEINIIAAIICICIATIYNLLTDFKRFNDVAVVAWSILEVLGFKREYHWSGNIIAFVLNQVVNVVVFMYLPGLFLICAISYIIVGLNSISEELNANEL